MSDNQLTYILSDFTLFGYAATKREVERLSEKDKQELKEMALAEGWSK